MPSRGCMIITVAPRAKKPDGSWVAHNLTRTPDGSGRRYTSDALSRPLQVQATFSDNPASRSALPRTDCQINSARRQRSEPQRSRGIKTRLSIGADPYTLALTLEIDITVHARLIQIVMAKFWLPTGLHPWQGPADHTVGD